MSSFKSNENIHKKEDGSCYVVSAKSAWINTRNIRRGRFAFVDIGNGRGWGNPRARQNQQRALSED